MIHHFVHLAHSLAQRTSRKEVFTDYHRTYRDLKTVNKQTLIGQVVIVGFDVHKTLLVK